MVDKRDLVEDGLAAVDVTLVCWNEKRIVLVYGEGCIVECAVGDPIVLVAICVLVG